MRRVLDNVDARDSAAWVETKKAIDDGALDPWARDPAVPAAEPVKPPACTCFHAPEQHDPSGCGVSTLMNGPCACKYDGTRP